MCADFTRDVALNYVKRGYHLLCRHAITLFLLPVGGTLVVRLPLHSASDLMLRMLCRSR